MSILVVHAPPGAGKSSHAEQLREAFNCQRIVEEWDGVASLNPGDLALTNIPMTDHPKYQVLTLTEALELKEPS